jgi:hypothetical protein
MIAQPKMLLNRAMPSLSVRPNARLRLFNAAVRRNLFLAFLLLGGVHASAADIAAPAKNWVLPLFTAEGFRLMTARGSEARAVSKDRFDVVDLNLTLFSNDAAMHVDTILLSPAASFSPDAMVARGDNGVRFIRADVEASGRRWVYQHNGKKISLDGEVRVTFQTALQELF